MKTRLVQGVGINDAPYQIETKDPKFLCPFYNTWRGMLRRCYSSKHHKVQPTYSDCETHKEWHSFMNFRSWMEKQDWKDKQLDKDILGSGKLYSKDTCCFVSSRVNKFILRANEGTSVGVLYNGYSWLARCKDLDCSSKHIGSYDTAQEARVAYLNYKLDLLESLRVIEKIPDNVYNAIKNKYSEA